MQILYHQKLHGQKDDILHGTSLVDQRLRLCNAGDVGLIPGQGIKISHAAWCVRKEKEDDSFQNTVLDDYKIVLVMIEIDIKSKDKAFE